MNHRFFLPWSLGLGAALVASAGAQTIYVSPSGDDTAGDGSASNPYATIQQALNVAEEGDTINVAAGTYRENLVWEGKSLTLQGAGDVDGDGHPDTVVDGDVNGDGTGDGRCLTITNVPGTARLQGFTFQNGNGCPGGGLSLNGSPLTVADNEISYNTSDVVGGMYVSGSDATLIGNTFLGNTTVSEAKKCSNGGGLELITSNATLLHNTFTGNTAEGSGGGVIVACFSQVTMIGNTITGNTAGGDGGGVYVLCLGQVTMAGNMITGNTADGVGGGMATQSPATLTNNTIADNLGEGVANLGDPDALTITNCILWGNGGDGDLVGATATYSCIGTGETEGEGNIAEEPQFVGSGDYHLQETSPCLNKGDNAAPSLPPKDIDGQGRVLEGVVDLGADEIWPALQPDLWIRQPRRWLGRGVYNGDGTQQTGTRTVGEGGTAVFPACLFNWEETATFWLQGPAGTEDWTVQYYEGTTQDPDREITDQVTSATGWECPDLAREGKQKFLIAVTPGPGVTGSYEVLVTATSDPDPTRSDTIKATTTVGDLQPDLWIRQQGAWLGDGVYNNDGTDQTGTRDRNAVYRVRLYNDGDVSGTFFIQGSAGNENWTVRYYRGKVVREDREVTPKVTRKKGWKRANVPPGESRCFLITVTADPGTSGTYPVQVVAQADRTPVQLDCIQAVTTVTNVQPDLWIKQGDAWRGDNVYNEDGTDQTRRRSKPAGETATYWARLYNDGDEAETFFIKGPAGDADWTVEYYKGPKNVTAQVTSAPGWKRTDVPPGGMRAFRIEVTSQSGLSSGSCFEILVQAQSKRDPLQRDALKTITTVE